jgi:hypothetical protein
LKKFLASIVRILLGIPLAGSVSTLNVIKAHKNFWFSPITIIFEHGKQISLKLSSIINGAIFSPPAVIISSLILPVISK